MLHSLSGMRQLQTSLVFARNGHRNSLNRCHLAEDELSLFLTSIAPSPLNMYYMWDITLKPVAI